MRATDIAIVVVAVPERAEMALRLAAKVGGDEVLIDGNHSGALYNHLRALGFGATSRADYLVVMEDDAIPCDDFREHAEAWFRRCPDDLISFYLGTARPPQYMDTIDIKIQKADESGDDSIVLNRLVHGVSYGLPTKRIDAVLTKCTAQGAADFVIGDAWRNLIGRPVIYPVVSLVDHRDGEVIEHHRDGAFIRGYRHARRWLGGVT